MESYQHFTLFGIIFIVAGILLVILPLIAQHLPSLEKIPWIILWTFKGDNFVFVTSPIIIIIISLILYYLKH